jgi:DNA-binding CsgD family transcriptional regulator
VFAYPPAAPPVLLHDAFSRVSSPEALENYFSGAYLLDCVYTACRAGAAPGLYRLEQLAPDAFFEGEYYNSPDVHPCISMETGTLAEEIVFLAPLEQGAIAAYSLMRSNGREPFSIRAFNALKSREAMVLALLTRHFRGASALRSAAQEDNDKTAFDTFRADTLSAREQMIAGLILQGHSTTSIALNLGIAEGTVKIHRKNLYAKLSISSQAELFAMFLKHLRR